MNDVINELNIELKNSEEIQHSGSIFDFSAQFNPQKSADQAVITFDPSTSQKETINYANNPFEVELNEDQYQYGIAVNFLYKLDDDTAKNYTISAANIKQLDHVKSFSTSILDNSTSGYSDSVLKLAVIVPKDLPLDIKTELKFDIVLADRVSSTQLNSNLAADTANLIIDPILIIGRPIPPR
ncbi:hypothetical protein [Pseudoalteromonas luteoviolacea]|uniref:Uncharacterized protein n=1 Tax=Pseudoalteromonas luteoviolacea S4054 TaxID=1129367 RepID=A0A0F6ABW9_9GAMM|nr:hypothetical protein [Pseudoalteromonas luteoviolacea]AOT09018.1 hypothetical protein S4054249_14610 [Pseudoalteromonas luteoviolacea]AOT13930.1 hypothetical protein S40542_14580 [Pseudoalteromonas luteoviolacea]AOT18845.1 hypothetical protein S4054_14585 [Pseudoalteromonas luteoviolacea]KKE83653.1 hypothetical protein N479_01085 [Pseudoalteromonas luteoviolacea S4054]KZN63408.1 hypothetical protein N481_25590 [Pseudoalteromonas luteoviolacea S4047-1]